MPTPQGDITTTQTGRVEAAAEAAIEAEAIDKIIEEELVEPEDDLQ